MGRPRKERYPVHEAKFVGEEVKMGLLGRACVGGFVLWAGVASLALAEDTATLILRSGVIETLDDANPRAEAVAIRNDRVLIAGTLEEVLRYQGDETNVVDLGGRLVVPGFIESHGHFQGLGELLAELDLTTTTSWPEVVKKVAAVAQDAADGEWIVGRGWHQSLWREPAQPNIDGYPVHQALSKVTPRNPVMLVHRSGHLCFANALAMQLAGVDGTTPDPAGGELMRDAEGAASGVFRETAQNYIYDAYYASRENLTAADLHREFVRHAKLAEQECLRLGVTSFQDAGVSPGAVRKYAEMYERGTLSIRLWIMLNGSNAVLNVEAPRLSQYRDFANHHLTVGGIKEMADGALGTHGAWLLAPYRDLAGSRGLAVTPISLIRGAAEIAFANRLQLCTHAIGDRANREVLDLYEEFVRRSGGRELRWRVEHAQHLHPSDIPRFAQLGVIASMQANHATSDGPFVVARLGEQRAREGAYVWRSLLKAGAKIANGTDTPVENVDPIACFYSAVTRNMKDGKAFYPEQALTPREALRAYTLDAAYAAFQEDQKGSLEPGKLADLVVLSRNILDEDPEVIPQTKVDLTIVGGEILFQRKGP